MDWATWLGCPSRLTQAQPLSDPVSWWGDERRAERGCSILCTVWGLPRPKEVLVGSPACIPRLPAGGRTQSPLLPVADASPGLAFGGGLALPLPPSPDKPLKVERTRKATLPVLLICAWTQHLQTKHPHCGRSIPGNTECTGGGQQRRGWRHTWTHK